MISFLSLLGKRRNGFVLATNNRRQAALSVLFKNGYHSQCAPRQRLPFCTLAATTTTKTTTTWAPPPSSSRRSRKPFQTRRHFLSGLMESLRGGAVEEPQVKQQEQAKEQVTATTDVSQNFDDPVDLLGVYPVSVCSIRGYRNYMEDEFCTAHDFCACFDGHGGTKISRYLRQNLYAEVQAALPAVLAAGSSILSPDVAAKDNQKESTSATAADTEAALEPPTTTTTAETSTSSAAAANQKEAPIDPMVVDTKTNATTTANAAAALSSASTKRPVTVQDYESALRLALSKVDGDVQRISHWSYQGSTAVVTWIHESKPEEEAALARKDAEASLSSTDASSAVSSNGTSPSSSCSSLSPQRTLVVANVGDSRAVLSRNESVLQLTRDHKPNDPLERGRIEAAGGHVFWHGHVDNDGYPVAGTGVYRVNGNLALSRAIGDRSERPVVTAEPDISIVPLQDEVDDFVVLATDGLWDVMTSADVVAFIHSLKDGEERDTIASMLVEEALRRGSYDNITVIIVWLSDVS